ncbi:SLAM family member 7-like [Scomber scombrus]|uniref:SLAM family member 7-like n=1 Tax=Scomber scombrus TaxID=13677 RepID=UPI002DD7AEC0|nr:SLAM family member 7-like [Scomber scombrus]
MVGCCLSYVLKHSAVLLLWAFLHDVEASSCDRIINKKVGDTVELSSCLPTEGVTVAIWQYNNTKVADMDIGDAKHPQFIGRVELNLDYSLTVRRLTPQDSGVYSLTSEVNDKQRDTVYITLQVHAPLEIITQQPSLTVYSTSRSSNESCTVVGECRAASHTKVSYNWTVRGETHSGSRLQYNIQPEDGDIEFTCTIFNAVSETSASHTVKCSNNTSTDQNRKVIIFVGVAAGSSLMLIMVAVGIAVCVRQRKQRQASSDSHDLTVYADITDVAPPDRTITMKPSSLYDTIDNRTNAFTPAPQTVYDKIQFNRMGNSSVSPYQEVS